jgi:8-oxo-dGTP pyrophosphatase MutT (NUDIX family)
MTLPITNRALFVFLVDPEGRILLELRDSQAPVSPNQWSVPGGQIEAGESPEAAARRELLEETGLRVEGAAASLLDRDLCVEPAAGNADRMVDLLRPYICSARGCRGR